MIRNEAAETVEISLEALRRMRVECAYARGEPIEVNTNRCGEWIDWRMSYAPSWDWKYCDYRVKGIDATPRRTKAQILDQIHELLVELRQLDGDV